MDDPEILSRVVVVLSRPKSPGNVGSVARAMKNMGLTRLRIAGPARFEDPSFFKTEAGRMAWNAADVLEAREEHPSLESAVADTVLVAGTTSVPPDGLAAFAPRDLAPRLLDAAESGAVALVLGRENLGLTRAERARCQILGTIPASPLYASLNLAQAALIFLYEIRLAALERAGAPRSARSTAPVAPGGGRRARAAPHDPPAQAEIERFYGRLAETLDAIGFLAGGAREHMIRDLRRIFNRALLTRREVAILEGIVRRVDALRARSASPRT